MNHAQRTDSYREVSGGNSPAMPFDWTARFLRPARRTTKPVGPSVDPLMKWIELIRAGRADGLRKLYDATQQPVRNLAYRMTRDSFLAAEMTEATFVQAWLQAARYNPPRGNVMSWLLCIARSRAIDAMRNARGAVRQTDRLVSSELEPEPHADPESLAVEAERAVHLHHALNGLTALQRQLLARAYFKGSTHEEIARELSLPLGTVKSHIKRALASLRCVLSARLGSDVPKKCHCQGSGRRAGSSPGAPSADAGRNPT